MKRPIALALALIAVGLPHPRAAAASWEINPRVEAGYQYDDNYRLALPGNEIAVSGALADAQLELKTATPVIEFSFTPRVRATYFPDDDEESSEDYFAGVQLLQRGQTMQATVRLDYAKEDVVSSEQPGTDIDTGLGEPGVGEGGRVVVRNRRTLVSFVPSLSHELAPRHDMTYELRYVDVGFDQEIPGVQVGYSDAQGAVGWAFDFSQRSTLTTRARASRYEINEGDQRSDAYGLELELGSETTQTTRSFLRVGAQNTDFTRPNGDSANETSWLAGAGVRWTAGLTEVFADATRTVGPTSSGSVVERDQLRGRLNRAITPRFSLFTGLRGVRDEAVDAQSSFQGRRYAVAEVGMRWRLQQQLSIGVTVDYTWQEFEVDPTDATSSGALLTLIYEPRRRD